MQTDLIPVPRELLERFTGYAIDLSNEWVWKRNTTARNNSEMADIDADLRAARALLSNAPTESESGLLRESLKELVAAMYEYEMEVDGEAHVPSRHRLMMRRAEALLNTPSPPTTDFDHHNPGKWLHAGPTFPKSDAPEKSK